MKFKEFLSESTTEFGKILFGEFKEFYGSVKEPCTEYEKKVFSELGKFISDKYTERTASAFLIKALKLLKKYENLYSNIVKPDRTKLFRGTTLPYNERYKIEKIEMDNDWVQGEFIYSGKKEIQSWTINFDTAYRYAQNGFSEKNLPIVLKYNFPEHDIIFNTKFTNAVCLKFHNNTKENEIIRLNNKPIKCTVIVDKDDWE